jgi:ABC-type Fe3+/spermidine/putrescine transport system ATPase subunit
MALFLVNEISFNYHQNTTIPPITFQLEKNEFLSIVGESGSGKSTLLKLFAGLLNPQTGKMYIDNDEILAPEKKLIPGHEAVKLVTQDYKLNPNFTLLENVCYQLRTYTKEYQQERSNYLLNLFKIDHLSKQLPRNVSGGERQRTAFACALAEIPKLLLLDEPFSNLDNINKEIVKESLLSIRKTEQLACILVTHDLLDALSLGSQIMVIKNGQVLTIEPGHNLLKGHKNPYVQQYLNAAMKPYYDFQKLIS